MADRHSLTSWVREAVDVGIECLDITTKEVLIGIETDSGEGHSLTLNWQSEDDSDDRLLRDARHTVAEYPNGRLYAIVWIALLDCGEEESQYVIVVEAGERQGLASAVAQPFEVTDDYRLEKVGEARQIGPPENIWAPGWDAERPDAYCSFYDNLSESDVETDDKVTLEEFAEAVINEAFERLQAKNQKPFLCLLDQETAEQVILPAQSVGKDFIEQAEELREMVKSLDYDQYAISYITVIEENNRNFASVVAETGDRNGDAATFYVKFKLNNSLKLKRSKMKFLEEQDNLWASEA